MHGFSSLNEQLQNKLDKPGRVPCSLFAQATGRISGIVTDASEARVSEANVECRNTETGLLSRTTTNAGGLFHFPELPIGAYQITVAHTGFQTLVRSGIELLTGHTVDLKLQVQVGAVTQAIEVTTESLRCRAPRRKFKPPSTAAPCVNFP